MSRLILAGKQESVARLLRALGAAFTECSLEALLRGDFAAGDDVALILVEADLVSMSTGAGPANPLLNRLPGGSKVLLWPFAGTSQGRQALSELVSAGIQIVPVNGVAMCKLAADRSFCGPFAGLEFSLAHAASERGLVVQNLGHPWSYLAEVNGAGLMTRVMLPRGELFVATSSRVFDVAAEVVRNLDATTCFSSLVPLVFFLRHCQIPYWRTPHHWANLIIDDPNLRPDYGFVNARALARQVDQLQCAVSIGFIPWNFKRTSPAVVELFRSRWPRLSLCMHGCDHTNGEFATSTPAAALQLAALGLDRMGRLAAATDLRFDKVIVFPQGIFSRAALQALRQTDLLAAVNTELVDHLSGRGVPGADLLPPAITTYGGFPLFIRRKADEPIADFALDLLLGKPCLIVTHHEFFRDGLQPLAALVHSINAMVPQVNWTNLESIVSRSFSVRRQSDSTADVRLFSATTRMDAGDLPGQLRFQKSESLGGRQFKVCFNGREVVSRLENGNVLFSNEPVADPPHTLNVEFAPKEIAQAARQAFRHRVKVSLRRHLSEVRDNYVARSPRLSAALTTVRQLVRGTP